MKGNFLAVVFSTVVSLVLLLNGSQAKAYIGPDLAVENVFAALNSGEVDTALALFSEDAVATNWVRGEMYVGLSEIKQMLSEMYRNGRRLDVVDLKIDGENFIVNAEVSDHGIAWGTETIVVEMKDGRIQSFNVTAFRLELWRLGR